MASNGEKHILAAAQAFANATASTSIEKELQRWSRPTVYPYPVDGEPPYEEFDPAQIYLKANESSIPRPSSIPDTPKRNIQLLRLYFKLAEKPEWTGYEEGLRGLTSLGEEFVFELVATNNEICFHLYGQQETINSLVSLWQLHNPQITARPTLHDPLSDISERHYGDYQVAEFYNSAPYYLRLSPNSKFHNAPINTFVISAANLPKNAIAFSQLRLSPVKNNWYRNMQRLFKADSYLGKRSVLAKSTGSETKISGDRPLFAMHYRVGCIGASESSFKTLLRHAGMAQAGGEALSYLDKRQLSHHLPADVIMAMPRNRHWHIIGIAADSSEGNLFVHLADSAVQLASDVDVGQIKGFPVAADLQGPGILLGENTYAGETVKVYIPLAGNTSTYMIGGTGSGKSVSQERQGCEYVEKGFAKISIDMHGDSHHSHLSLTSPKDEVRTDVLDFSDPNFIPRLNLFRTENQDDIGPLASDYADSIRLMFPDSWGPRLNHVLVHTLAGLFVLGKNLSSILPLLTSEQSRYEKMRQRIIEESSNPEITRFWKEEYSTYNKKEFSPLINKISTLLLDPRLRRMFSSKDNSFDFKEIMDGRILAVNLSVGILGVYASAWIGNMILAHIQKHALRRASVSPDMRHPVQVFVDEFPRLKNLAICNSIINETRKYRVYLTASHQLTGQLSDEDFQSFTSLSNILVFKQNPDDARALAKLFNGMVTPGELINLDVGEVYARVNNQIVNFRTYPPLKGDPYIAERITNRCHSTHYMTLEECVERECKGKSNTKRTFDTF